MANRRSNEIDNCLRQPSVRRPDRTKIYSLSRAEILLLPIAPIEIPTRTVLVCNHGVVDISYGMADRNLHATLSQEDRYGPTSCGADAVVPRDADLSAVSFGRRYFGSGSRIVRAILCARILRLLLPGWNLDMLSASARPPEVSRSEFSWVYSSIGAPEPVVAVVLQVHVRPRNCGDRSSVRMRARRLEAQPSTRSTGQGIRTGRENYAPYLRKR
jgi:hypothetical protein